MSHVIAFLATHQDPLNVYVWHEGLTDWQLAGTRPELTSTLAQIARPVVFEGDGATPVERVERVARLYRRLILLIGAQLILAVLNQSIRISAATGGDTLLLAFAAFLAGFAIVIALAVSAYGLAKHLGSRVALLWAIGMFFPFVNIIVLLALSVQAQRWCRARGIKVGLLGPTAESLEKLRAGRT